MRPVSGWLEVTRGDAPLIVSLPHAGTYIPNSIAKRMTSVKLAREDTDWWLDRLYDFVPTLNATWIRTSVSRSVIDVNRDPSGVSLYPGQATTELCPTTAFDGSRLYRNAREPDGDEIDARRQTWFDPYHAALSAEIARLRDLYARIVVYDCHSIRSRLPRLFEGELQIFSIGTNTGRSCDPGLTQRLEMVCRATGMSHVVDGRFKGGYITRHYGAPASGVHAIQMELACRGYMHEPSGPPDRSWPSPYEPGRAEAMRQTLVDIFHQCLQFAGP